MPVASSRMVWRVLRCPNKQGIRRSCCFRALSACWVGGVSTQYFSIKCKSRLLGCMSLDFIAKGYGLAAPSSKLSRATLLALLADALLANLIWSVFVGFHLGRGCWVGPGRSDYDCIWIAKQMSAVVVHCNWKVIARLELFLSDSLLKGV